MPLRRYFLLFALFFAMSGVCAQETGVAAANSATAAQNSSWQNWCFAASALVSAATGVVLVSLNSGSTSH